MFLVIFAILIFIVLIILFFNDNYLLPQKIKKIDELLLAEQYEEALKLINSLTEKSRIQPQIQFKIYEIYLMQKQYFMGLFHLNEIIKRGNFEQERGEIFIRSTIAEIYELMEKPKKALTEYYSIISLDSENIIANKKVAEKLYVLKNFDAALPFLEKSYFLNKEDDLVCYYLSDVYMTKNEYEQALKMIDISYGLKKDKVKYILQKCKCHFRLQQFIEALPLLEEIVSDPTLGKTSKLLKGLCLFHTKNQLKAKELFALVLSKFTEDYTDMVLDARYIYSEMLYEDNMIKEALQELYTIRNSGKTYRDVVNKTEVLKKLLDNKPLLSIASKTIEEVVENELRNGFSQQGFLIIKKNIVDNKSAFLLLNKNISSGKSYKSVFAISLKQDVTDLGFIKKLVLFLKKEELTSASLFTLTTLEAEIKQYLKSEKIEITELSDDDFLKILSGE